LAGSEDVERLACAAADNGADLGGAPKELASGNFGFSVDGSVKNVDIRHVAPFEGLRAAR
jgi:hypothetical protein